MLRGRPRNVTPNALTKQAAASVGQVALVNAWSAAFGRYHRTVGQVLLTAAVVGSPQVLVPVAVAVLVAAQLVGAT